MTDKTAKPMWLEDLQSRILMGLRSPAEKEAWIQALYSAIPSGLPGEVLTRILTRIRDRFLHDVLAQKVLPLVREEDALHQGRIFRIVAQFESRLRSEVTPYETWCFPLITAKDSARYCWAARAAAAAAANDAGAAAAYAADAPADAAADDTAIAAAAYAAFWRWAASHLLKLIGEESAAWAARTA